MQNSNDAVVEPVQNPQDGTAIVPNQTLQEIIRKNEITSEDAQKMLIAFSGLFTTIEEWQGKNATLEITSADQKDEIELAAKGKKEIGKARRDFKDEWERIKAPYLKATQGLDAIHRYAKSIIEPLEASLKEKSQTAERLAQAEKDLLITTRKNQLLEIGYTEEVPSIGELPEDTFQMILDGAKSKVAKATEEAQRQQAESEARERNKAVIAGIVSLGGIEGEGGSYTLGTCVYVTDDSGISEEAAKKVIENFVAEKKRLDNRERVGRDRRELLLPMGLQLTWEQCADFSQEDWDVNLSKHTKAFEDRKMRAERAENRGHSIIDLGARKNDATGLWDLGIASCSVDSLVNMDDEKWATVYATFETEAQRIKGEADALQAKKDRANTRFAQLMELGAKRKIGASNNDLQLGSQCCLQSEFMDLNDDQWAETLRMFTEEANKIKAEQERKTNRTNDRLAKLREVQYYGTVAEVQDLSDVQFDTVLKAKTATYESGQKLAKKLELGNARMRELHAIKASTQHSIESLGALSDAEFKVIIDAANALKERSEKRRDSLVRLGAELNGSLYRLGTATCTMDEIATLDDTKWAVVMGLFASAQLAKSQADRKREEDAKAGAQANASDKEKLEKLSNDLSDLANGKTTTIKLPECKSKKGKDAVNFARQAIQEAAAKVWESI
jgi:hypothetical protein